MNQTLIASIIFIATLIFVSLEKINRTVIALSGGLLFILLKILNQQEAFLAVDFNTIGLLTGMMVINIIKAISVWSINYSLSHSNLLSLHVYINKKGSIFPLIFPLLLPGLFSDLF